jgi:hypothetical protein
MGAGPTTFFDRQARARRLTAVAVVAFILCFPAMLALQVMFYWGVCHLLERGPLPDGIFAIARVAAVVCGIASSVIIVLVATWNCFRGSRNGSSIALSLGGR